MESQKDSGALLRGRSRMIGYARVSTDDQDLSLQLNALKAAGCDRIFHDCISGAILNRPALDEALDYLESGDVLIVWKLDRLGRSLGHMISIIADLGARGVEFRSLTDPIDTTTAGGRLVFHIMGALAEFERALISERTKAGMAAAKARGALIGRPPKLTEAQIACAESRIALGHDSPGELAEAYGVSLITLERALKRLGFVASFAAR